MFDTKQLERFPTSSGVYLMKDGSGKVLYVGKAKNIKARVKQYFAISRDQREMVPHLVAEVAAIDTIIVSSEKEALLVENTLIKKHRPKYNVVLKDDKNYFSLMINYKHRWPMIRVVRFKGKPPSDALYFGPYTNGYAAKQTLELLRRLFPLRQCSDRELANRSRPCILHGMKRCVAPCVAKCTHEEYTQIVDQAIAFLKGHDTPLLKNLYKEMEKAVSELQFEKADMLHKTILNIEATLEKQQVVKVERQDHDVIGLHREQDSVAIAVLFFREGKLNGSINHLFERTVEEDDGLLTSFLLQHYGQQDERPHKIFIPIELEDDFLLNDLLSEGQKHQVEVIRPQRGEKKDLLEVARKNAEAKMHLERQEAAMKERVLVQLEEECHLTNYPERIECFDNSNLSGALPVSVMVVFEGGEKAKKHYRKYKIKPELASDDYAALEEVLRRRYSKAKENDDLPDLLVIDGGRGHLNLAHQVLESLDITTVDVIAVAKEESKHTKGMTAERIFLLQEKEPLAPKPNSPLLFFLQKVRDEAHRFAIAFQRKRRGKTLLKSVLEDLPGIGPIKKKRLLTHFGSVKRILEATDEELLAIQGITKKDVAVIRSLQV